MPNCTYCKKSFLTMINLGKLCKIPHLICSDCYSKSKLHGCYICNPQYRCGICKENPAIFLYECNIHGYCLGCKGIKSKCKICSKLQAYSQFKPQYKSQCTLCQKKNKQLFQISCDHKYCRTCIEQIIAHDIKKCQNQKCKKQFNKIRLEEVTKLIFQEVDRGSLNIKQINVKCLKCQNQDKIVSKEDPQYYKCTNCRAIICLQHETLIKQCKCKCQKCLMKLNGRKSCKKCEPKNILQELEMNELNIKIDDDSFKLGIMSSKQVLNQIKQKVCKKCGYVPPSNILINSYCKGCCCIAEQIFQMQNY